MERRSAETRTHTIRGKIWMMVILLAATNCVCSALAFVAGSFLFTAAWVPLALAVFVSAATTVGFAWWMSNDVLLPLDKLNLLAKSIERTPGMSVPNTTGAVETDDLLHTISRASRQLTNFVDLMDEVTAGNTKAALDPLEHSDRLSESFRRLIAKVTDSIDAKAELSELQRAIDEISNDLTGLQQGETVRIRSDFPATRTITDALKFLLERNSEMSRVLVPTALELKTISVESRNSLVGAIERHEARERAVAKLAAAVGELTTETERTLSGLAGSLGPISGLLESITNQPFQSEENAKSIAAMRRQFDAALQKLRDAGEQSLAISHVSKSVHDLAKRSNMIAVSTSIQIDGEHGAMLSALTQELTSLSKRAEKANHAIAGISESVVRDVNEANASLHWVTNEFSKVAARTSSAEDSLERVTETLSSLLELPQKIESDSGKRSERAERIQQIIDEYSEEGGQIAGALRSCESTLMMLSEPVEALRQLTSSRKQILHPIGHSNGQMRQQNGNGAAKNGTAVPETVANASE